MAKGKQRKQQKKQKAKRERQKGEPLVLAYKGDKYKTDELVPLIFETEVAVYECFVMSSRRLTDHHVRAALEKLIVQLRHGPLPEWDSNTTPDLVASGEVELVIANIRRSWHRFFQSHPHPGHDNVIGVLRTTLGSIEVWGSISPTSRGYLRYVEGFCNRLGVSVEIAPQEPGPLLAAE
jgi:hypothetical protein